MWLRLVRRVRGVMRGLVLDRRRGCRHGGYGGERSERQTEAGYGELVSARGCHWEAPRLAGVTGIS